MLVTYLSDGLRISALLHYQYVDFSRADIGQVTSSQNNRESLLNEGRVSARVEVSERVQSSSLSTSIGDIGS